MTQALGAVLVLVVIFAGWQYWRAEQLRELNMALEVSTQTQKHTIERQNQLAKDQAKVIEELGVENEKILKETSELSSKINSLRATEMARSLSAPFERALDADHRKCLELMRFAEEEGRDNNGTGGCDRFRPAGAEKPHPIDPVTAEPDINSGGG